MSQFTKNVKKLFQLEGVFCFYSTQRAAKPVLDKNGNPTFDAETKEPIVRNEYDTFAYQLIEGSGDRAVGVTVNYFGTMLSDGTPGGIAGDTVVRPDGAETYTLVGKQVGNEGGYAVVQQVDVKEEVARQLAAQAPKQRPSAAMAAAARPKQRKVKEHLTKQQQQQQKFSRNNFNNRQKAQMRRFVPR